MLKKILVCLDGSALAEKALPLAAELAGNTQARLILPRVIDKPITIPSPTRVDPDSL